MNNETLSADITENKYVKEYTYQQTVVLTTNVENFRVKLPNRFSEYLINRTLLMQEQAFLARNIKELYPDAVADYKNAQANGFPFNPFGAFLNYDIKYNENCTLSYYYDIYAFTGGAHGTTIRASDTFNLNTGREIPLWAYFKDKINYRKKVLDIISTLANEKNTEMPDIFFEDYQTLIKKYFNPESYYLSTDGIVIFYQQYEIAPYSSGIIEFTIPYTSVDYVPKCKPLRFNRLY